MNPTVILAQAAFFLFQLPLFTDPIQIAFTGGQILPVLFHRLAQRGDLLPQGGEFLEPLLGSEPALLQHFDPFAQFIELAGPGFILTPGILASNVEIIIA